MTKTNVANSKKVIALIALFAIMVTSVFALTITMPKSTASATEEPTLEFEITIGSVDVIGTQPQDSLQADGTAKALDMLMSGTPKVGIAKDTTFAINYVITQNDGIGESVWVPSYDSSKFALVSFTTASGSNWEIDEETIVSGRYPVSSKDTAMLCEDTGAFITVTYEAKEDIIDLGKYTFNMSGTYIIGDETRTSEVATDETSATPTVQDFNIYVRDVADIKFKKPTEDEHYVAKAYDSVAVTLGKVPDEIGEWYRQDGNGQVVDTFETTENGYYVNPKDYNDGNGEYIFSKNARDQYVVVPRTSEMYTMTTPHALCGIDYVNNRGFAVLAGDDRPQYLTYSAFTAEIFDSLKGSIDSGDTSITLNTYVPVCYVANLGTFSGTDDIRFASNSDGAMTATWYKDVDGTFANATKLAGAPVDAGTYWVKVTVAQTDNFAETSGELKFVIDKAQVVVTPTQDQFKNYDENDPDEFLYTYTLNGSLKSNGALYGTDTLSGALAREQGENAGFYAYTLDELAINQGTGLENYAISLFVGEESDPDSVKNSYKFVICPTPWEYEFYVDGKVWDNLGPVQGISATRVTTGDGAPYDIVVGGEYYYTIKDAPANVDARVFSRYNSSLRSIVVGNSPSFVFTGADLLDFVAKAKLSTNYTDVLSMYANKIEVESTYYDSASGKMYPLYVTYSDHDNASLYIKNYTVSTDKINNTTIEPEARYLLTLDNIINNVHTAIEPSTIDNTVTNYVSCASQGGAFYWLGTPSPEGLSGRRYTPNEANGSYTLILYIAGDENHVDTFSSFNAYNYTVLKRDMVYELESDSKYYGDVGAPNAVITAESAGANAEDRYHQYALTSTDYSAVTTTVKQGTEDVTIGQFTDAGEYSVTIASQYYSSYVNVSFKDTDPVSATATYTIEKRPVTITVDANLIDDTIQPYSKEWGEADPTARFEYRIAFTGDNTKSALASGQAISGAPTRAEGEAVGTYAYTIGTLKIMSDSTETATDVSSNYAITFADGVVFEITKSTKGLVWVAPIAEGDIVKLYNAEVVTAGEYNSSKYTAYYARGEWSMGYENRIPSFYYKPTDWLYNKANGWEATDDYTPKAVYYQDAACTTPATKSISTDVAGSNGYIAEGPYGTFFVCSKYDSVVEAAKDIGERAYYMGGDKVNGAKLPDDFYDETDVLEIRVRYSGNDTVRYAYTSLFQTRDGVGQYDIDYIKFSTGEATITWHADNSGEIGTQLESAPVNAGTYWVKVSLAADDNYAARDYTRKFAIGRANVFIALSVFMDEEDFDEHKFDGHMFDRRTRLSPYVYMEYGWEAEPNTFIYSSCDGTYSTGEGYWDAERNSNKTGFYTQADINTWDAMWNTPEHRKANAGTYVDYGGYSKGTSPKQGSFSLYLKAGALEAFHNLFPNYEFIFQTLQGSRIASQYFMDNHNYGVSTDYVTTKTESSTSTTYTYGSFYVVKNHSYFGDLLANGTWYHDAELEANKLTPDETTGAISYTNGYNGLTQKLIFALDNTAASKIDISYYEYNGQPATAPSSGETNAGATNAGTYAVKMHWLPKNSIEDPFVSGRAISENNFVLDPLEATLVIEKVYWDYEFYTDNKYWDGTAIKKGTSAREITSGENEGKYEVVGGEWYYTTTEGTPTVVMAYDISSALIEGTRTPAPGSTSYLMSGSFLKKFAQAVHADTTNWPNAYIYAKFAATGVYNNGTNGNNLAIAYCNPEDILSYSRQNGAEVALNLSGIVDTEYYAVCTRTGTSGVVIEPSAVTTSETPFVKVTNFADLDDTHYMWFGDCYSFNFSKYASSSSSVNTFTIAVIFKGDANHYTTCSLFEEIGENQYRNYDTVEVKQRPVLMNLDSYGKAYGSTGTVSWHFESGQAGTDSTNGNEYCKLNAIDATTLRSYIDFKVTTLAYVGTTRPTVTIEQFTPVGEYVPTISAKEEYASVLNVQSKAKKEYDELHPGSALEELYSISPAPLIATVTVSTDHKSQTVTVNGIIENDPNEKTITYDYYTGVYQQNIHTDTLQASVAYNAGSRLDKVVVGCSSNYTFGYDTDNHEYRVSESLDYAPSYKLRYNDDSTKHDGSAYVTGFVANDSEYYLLEYYFVDDATNGYTVTLMTSAPLTDYTTAKYQFDGWGIGDATTASEKVTLKNADVTVYGLWTKLGSTVSYVYRLNGATSWTTLTWIPSGQTEPVSSELLTESSTLRAIPSFLHNYWFATDGWHKIENYGKAGELVMLEAVTTVPEDDTVLGCEFTLSTKQTGDINGDGVVNINDVTTFRKWYIGYNYQEIEKIANKTDAETTAIAGLWAKKDAEEVDDMFFIDRANVNGDSKKNLSDVVAMRMAIVGGYNYYMYKDINGINGQFVTNEKIVKEVATFAQLETALQGEDRYIKLTDELLDGSKVFEPSNLTNKRVEIDLNGYSITCKSFSLTATGNSNIAIKNGEIHAYDGININVPDGVLTLTDVEGYVNGGKVELNAASHSIHFNGLVAFYGSDKNTFAPVYIPASAHAVVEEDSALVVNSIMVVKSGTSSFSLEVKGGTPSSTAQTAQASLLTKQKNDYNLTELTKPMLMLTFVEEKNDDFVPDNTGKAFVEGTTEELKNVVTIEKIDEVNYINDVTQSDRLIDGEPDGYTHVASASELLEVFNEAYSADKLPAKLDNDITLSGSYYYLSNSTTLDLNGHKLTITSGDYGRLYIIDNATLTIDGTTQGSKVLGTLYVGDANKQGNLVIDGGEYQGSRYTAIQSNGSGAANISATNAIFKESTQDSDTAAYLAAAGSYNFTNCSFTGFSAVYVKSGIPHNYNNCTFTATATSKNAYAHNNNGCDPTGDAFIIDNCYYPGGNAGVTFDANCKFYENNVEVTGATRYWYAANTTNLNSALDEEAELVHLDKTLADSLSQQDMREGYALVGNCVIKNTLTCTVNSESELRQALEAKLPSVQLGADIQATEILCVDYELELDLNGKTISAGNGWIVKKYINDAIIAVKRGGDLTVTGNGTITANGNGNVYSAIKMTANGETANGKDAKLTVQNGTFKGYYYAICGNGNRHDTNVTINAGNFSCYCTNDGAAIYQPQNGTLTINGGTFSGFSALYIKSGSLTIPANSTATFTATASECKAYSYSGNGGDSTGDGIVIDNCFYPGENATINIGAGVEDRITVTAEDASKIATYWCAKTAEQLEVAMNARASFIQLGADINLTKQLVADYDFTLDLHGKKLTYVGETTLKSGVIGIKRGATLTVNDSVGTGGIYSTSKAYAAIALTIKGESETGAKAGLVVNGGNFSGYYYAICGNGSRQNTEITINDGNFSSSCADDGFAVFHPQNGLLTINGGNFTGFSALYVKSGTLTIPADSTATFTATASELTAYSYNGNGANPTGDAIIIDNCFYPGTNATVNIAEGYDQSNITVTADGASKIATYWYAANDEQLNIAKQAGAECINLSSDMVSAVTATPVEGYKLVGNKIVKDAE